MRVLVVEDNPDTAQSLATVLRLYGHDVQVVYDGPSGLLAAQAGQLDVVLLDIGLPGIDGWEVTRRLRQSPLAHQPTIIAVTGYGQEQDRKRSREVGVDFHFVKPAEPKRLLGVLDRLQQLHSA